MARSSKKGPFVDYSLEKKVIKAKENKLQPEEYIGGSISISNPVASLI